MTDQNTDEAATPTATPKAQFASMAGRTKIVPLTYPIEFDGKVYSEIPLRRVTGVEIAAYIEAVDAGEKVAYPGLGVPSEVYEALDADDAVKFMRELNDFLPQGFGAEVAPAR